MLHLDIFSILMLFGEEFYFPNEELSARKQNMSEVILQILSSLCLTSHYKVIKIDKKQPKGSSHHINSKKSR